MTDTTGTDLVPVDPTASTVATVGDREFAIIQRQADTLSRSDIIPKAYRGRPANIIAAALVGRQYGWDPMTSMRYGHVVEGNYDVKPEAMLGLIRRAGHSVRFEEHRDDNIAKCGVTAHGKRADTGDEDGATFLIGDAVRARLCTIQDNRVRARSKQGNPLPWEQYPLDMCQWRAVGRLVRRLFSDIGVGIYTATEFTELVDDEGVEIINAGPIEHTPAPDAVASPLSDAAIASFRDACAKPKAGDPIDPDRVLAKAFPNGVPDQLTDHHLPAMQEAFLALVNEGLEAAAKGDTPPAPTEPPPEQPPATAVPDDDDRPATRGQVGKIKAQYARHGVHERDDQMPLTGEFIGREVTSHNKLTRTEALRVYDWLSHAKSIDDLGDALVAEGEIVEDG